MKVAKITLYADQQQEVKNWWIEKFGFELIMENQMGPNMTWIEIGNKSQDVSIIIYDRALMQKQKPDFNVVNPHIMFSTTNAKNEYERLIALGVVVYDYMEMPYGTMFQFKDSEGNEFVVRQD